MASASAPSSAAAPAAAPQGLEEGLHSPGESFVSTGGPEDVVHADAPTATPSDVGSSASTSRSSKRCAFLRERSLRFWILLGIACVLLGIGSYMCMVVVPSWIIAERISQASIMLESMYFEVDEDSSNLQPHFTIFVPKKLLQAPLNIASYKAVVAPQTVEAYIEAEAMKRPGQQQGDTVMAQVGQIAMGEVSIQSTHDLNLHEQATFSVTSDEYMASTVGKFMKDKEVKFRLQGTMNIKAYVWGWMPFWFNNVEWSYDVAFPGFNSFKDRPIALDKILEVDGEPGELTARCTATIFNPTPITMVANDALQLDLSYNFTGIEAPIGSLYIASGMKMVPGSFTREATMVLRMSDSNQPTLDALASAYLGGVQNGFSTSGLHPFTVTVRDAGEATARSPLLKKALNGMHVEASFKPAPLSLVTEITADITVLGSMAHWPPNLYQAMLHVWVHNPLPTEVQVRGVNVVARSDNLEGPVIYDYNHEQPRDRRYVCAPNAITRLDFELGIADYTWPDLGTLGTLIRNATQRNLTVGVDCRFQLTVAPGYEVSVPYLNNAISGTICYHGLLPTSPCGTTPQAAELLALPLGSNRTGDAVVVV